MRDQTRMAYIGRTTTPLGEWPAGAVVAASTIDRDTKKITKTVTGWLKDGLSVEQVPVEWVRKYLGTTERYQPEATP